ncbi:acyl--CoA ligase [Gemmobacter fulvus]|uniref:Acyl--CoA ligase n=1 Tax=Gemmobacter fulvus TaxID=2840474 RepID=A0A975S219_9RHOB|nr:class I adenylate-forming enzyme family protein [Gemmobacter fulvus]MBT9245144.1 acyl--CoA ligase [Gemmobacter fulvus]QWK90518.1 acyl--CoA ligase [Gemmobacter fulvus]
MLSVSDPGVSVPCPAPFNLAQYVLAEGATRPDRQAMQIVRPDGCDSWNYARLIAAVRGAGRGLLALGLVPGDRVLLRLGNTPDFPVAFLGAIAAGLVPVPTSSQLTTAEITGMSARVDPQLIIAGDDVALPEAPGVPMLAAAALADMAALAPCDWAMGDPDRPAYVIFTSGSSGRPQAVCHAHRAIWARRMMHQGWEGLRPEDRLLHAGAFNWTYTLGTGLMDPWTLGATALIPGAGVTPDQLPRLLQQYEATICAAAPGVFRQMLRAPLPALPHLRHGLSAGESLPPALRQAWRAATGTDLHEALGMSECSTFISGAPGRPAPEGCAGYAQPGRAIAILGNDGQPVPRDEAGMLAVSRHDPGLMLHYVQDPVETAARFRGDWFLTGDLAVMRKDGALTYLGRDDDQMNPGGYRVSPQEVEAALAGLPGVQDIAVTEVEVKPGSKVVACFYVAPQPLDPATLAAFAAERLARYRQPRLWQHVVALPRNANGKLNRRALAAAWRPE